MCGALMTSDGHTRGVSPAGVQVCAGLTAPRHASLCALVDSRRSLVNWFTGLELGVIEWLPGQSCRRSGAESTAVGCTHPDGTVFQLVRRWCGGHAVKGAIDCKNAMIELNFSAMKMSMQGNVKLLLLPSRQHTNTRVKSSCKPPAAHILFPCFHHNTAHHRHHNLFPTSHQPVRHHAPEQQQNACFAPPNTAQAGSPSCGRGCVQGVPQETCGSSSGSRRGAHSAVRQALQPRPACLGIPVGP